MLAHVCSNAVVLFQILPVAHTKVENNEVITESLEWSLLHDLRFHNKVSVFAGAERESPAAALHKDRCLLNDLPDSDCGMGCSHQVFSYSYECIVFLLLHV